MQWAREGLLEELSLCWDSNSRLDFDRDGGDGGSNSLIKGWEMARPREIQGRAKGLGGSEARREGPRRDWWRTVGTS